ncbi:MAG TPA: hypothetical protein PKC99_00265 [Anaerolineales bacterium]|nr:hypothetical protein [Anaerolineales bacterium]
MNTVKSLISARRAGNILIVSLSLLLVFHVLVLFRLAPAEIVWGGQAVNSPDELFILEGFGLFLTFIFLAIVSAKVGYINANSFIKPINVFLWIIFVYLILNFGSNLVSKTFAENVLFAPVTIIMAFLVYRLILES